MADRAAPIPAPASEHPDRLAQAPAARGPALPTVNHALYRGFVRYSRWYVKRHFHAVRLAEPGWPAVPDDEPVLVYLNHPGWWDPLVGLMLAVTGFSTYRHYAPIETAALGQYRFFERLGFFGIEPGTAQGSARFLRLGERIMREPGCALWVTAEGFFTDVRHRPVTLRPGVAHLARRLERGVIVPLALEYPFWHQRLPEALARFGEPIDIRATRERSVSEWQYRLRTELERAMDALAARSMRRDASEWRPVLRGASGTGALYDTWRRVRCWMRGERFARGHMGEDSDG